jgi:hypothetical protein
MVCNAIYAVSRTARLVFQSPASPFNVQKMGERPLPALRFADTCPVYFDRHTLSLKVGKLSLFTLDGRMQFELTLAPEQLALFETGKLREVVLSRGADGVFVLSFWLESGQALAEGADLPEGQEADALPAPVGQGLLIPDYVSVEVA